MLDGTGYLTPDYDGNAGLECSRLSLPSYLWRFVSGALGELTELSNWVQFGDMTPEQMVYIFTDAIDDMRVCDMIGSILPFARATLPDTCLPCDGTTYQRTDYPLLYAALPAHLILNADEFITPDLQDRFLLADGTRNQGDTGGAETHTLTESEMPTHTHAYTAAGPSVTTIVVPDEPSAVPIAATTAPAGGSQPHNNMPPYYTVIFGIVAK